MAVLCLARFFVAASMEIMTTTLCMSWSCTVFHRSAL